MNISDKTNIVAQYYHNLSQYVKRAMNPNHKISDWYHLVRNFRWDFKLILLRPLCYWLALSQSFTHWLIALSSRNQFGTVLKLQSCSTRLWLNAPILHLFSADIRYFDTGAHGSAESRNWRPPNTIRLDRKPDFKINFYSKYGRDKRRSPSRRFCQTTNWKIRWNSSNFNQAFSCPGKLLTQTTIPYGPEINGHGVGHQQNQNFDLEHGRTPYLGHDFGLVRRVNRSQIWT